MFLKQLNHHWNKAKSFVGHGYRQLGKLAADADKLAGVGRKIFSLATPMLEDLGQGDVIKQGVSAIQGYDNLRRGVMDVDAKARQHAGRFADADIFS